MKAARLHAFHEKLQLEDVPEPELTGPNDVIVKIGAASAGPTCTFGKASSPSGSRQPTGRCRTPLGTRTPAGSRRSGPPSPTWRLATQSSCTRSSRVACACTAGPGTTCTATTASFRACCRRRLRRAEADERAVAHQAGPEPAAYRRCRSRRRRADRVPRGEEGGAAALSGNSGGRHRSGWPRPHRDPVPGRSRTG